MRQFSNRTKTTKSTPLRVLHFFGRMTWGGAELRTVSLMQYVDPQAITLEFCALSGKSGELDEEIKSYGGSVHYLPLDRHFPRRLSSLLRNRKIDVVHSHVHYASGLIAVLAALAGVEKRIVHFRNTSDGNTYTGFRKVRRQVLKQLIDRFATDIVGVSEGAMTEAWSASWRRDKRCQVIYNGIPTERFLPSEKTNQRYRKQLGLDKADDVIINVGRFDPQKNKDRVLRIFAEQLRVNTNAVLLLAGRVNEEQKAAVFASLQHEGVDPGRVRVLGVRADIPELLSVADVMLHPSLWEGLPGVLLEAAAAGLPVVASELPGAREIAQYFPTVKLLPLESSNRRWSDELSLALDTSKSTHEEILASFELSPFRLSTAAENHKRLWTG